MTAIAIPGVLDTAATNADWEYDLVFCQGAESYVEDWTGSQVEVVLWRRIAAQSWRLVLSSADAEGLLAPTRYVHVALRVPAATLNTLAAGAYTGEIRRIYPGGSVEFVATFTLDLAQGETTPEGEPGGVSGGETAGGSAKVIKQARGLQILRAGGARGLSAKDIAIDGEAEGLSPTASDGEFADWLRAPAVEAAAEVAEAVTGGLAQIATAGSTQVNTVSAAGATQTAAVNGAGTTQVAAVQAAGATQVDAVEAAGGTQVTAVNSAGATQVGAVNTAGGAQVTAVEGAGATQVAAVNAAGSTQVGAVETAGGTQVAAVNSAGTTQVAAVNAAGGAQVATVEGAGATQVAAVNAAGSTQVGAVEAAGAARIEEIEASLGVEGFALIDSVGPEWGFDGGWAITDPDGWTTPDFHFSPSGQTGQVQRWRSPGENNSGLPGAYRIWKYPLWSLEPTAFLKTSSIGASGGRHMANSLSATPPSDNLFAFPAADLKLVSTSQMTRTKQYGPGPSGGPEDDTLRVQYTANGTVVAFINRVIPAGTWDISVLARGVTPATTWDIRRGATGSLTADTVDDTAFKLLERAAGGVVSDGVANTDFRILGNGSNQPDIEYTQLQGFPLGQKPSWADEMADTPFNWHFKKQWSFAGSITTDGNGELIMTSGENFGWLFPAGFPDPLSVSDLVLHLMVDVTSAAANTRIISTEASSGDATISPATTTSTLYIGCSSTDGLLATAPVNTGSSGANINLVNAGPMIITLVHKGGFRGVWVDGVPVNVLNTAVTTYAIRVLQCFGTSAGAGAPGGTCIGIGVRFNQAPDAAMIAADVLKMQYEFASAWARGGTRNKFAYSGDSVWAAFTGAQGPSAAFAQGNPGYHSRPLPTINRALSGSNISRMRTRFLSGLSDINPAPTWIYGDKQLHEAGRAAGNNMIFAFDTSFANDQARFGVATVASLIADTQELAAWGKAATGNPTIIMGAIDANIATSDTRAGRDIYETAMLDGSDPDGDYVYVSLADTTLWTWNLTDFDDDLHLRGNSAGNGHDKAKAPLHDAIDPQLAA